MSNKIEAVIKNAPTKAQDQMDSLLNSSRALKKK
jgi:hypothetical protein